MNEPTVQPSKCKIFGGQSTRSFMRCADFKAMIYVFCLPGEVSELPLEKRVDIKYPYRPKLPLPRDCISHIDAGFMIDGSIYLISNTFVWQYDADDLTRIGNPRRISDVFAGWNFVTRAAFAGKIIFLMNIELFLRTALDNMIGRCFVEEN